jgi:FKBP12-rapamycin complex-associated protein
VEWLEVSCREPPNCQQLIKPYFAFKKKVNELMKEETVLHLGLIAPELTTIPANVVAVPNTFETGERVMIGDFIDKVIVQLSKQRPCKLTIRATNGKRYKFLLKGHEDLRQDQRVLQFFDLINSIVSSSMPKIIVALVTPLSPFAGMIRWLRKCATMHHLIQQYRASDPDRYLHEEIDIVADATFGKMADPHWVDFIDNLRPIQRLEALNVVLSKKSSNDLRQMLWLTAVNAEAWVRHIANFSKTTAVMSIVGYVIGLGDRHPRNIMVSRLSGSVAHIDFGDCFEVDKERSRLPEPIPFRLTRMMVAAFGPCGIDGSFRVTCEQTVSTIRAHREAIKPVLEIFVREPVSSGGFFARGEVAPISGSIQLDDTQSSQNSDPTGQSEQQHRLAIMKRMIHKIDGLDFENVLPLTVADQVDRLISEATDRYNLAYLYHGWNPMW